VALWFALSCKKISNILFDVFDIISKRLEIETLASMAWQSRSTRER
jgi:hypothetical protein